MSPHTEGKPPEGYVPREVIMLVGTKKHAEAQAERLGVPPHLMLWPRSPADLLAYRGAPVWLDATLESHPQAEALGAWFGASLGYPVPLWRVAALGQDPRGKALN